MTGLAMQLRNVSEEASALNLKTLHYIVFLKIV